MSNSNKVSCLKQEMYRQRWIEEVSQCNNRPDGMTVTDWCNENNLIPSTYYAHARKVRESYLDQLQLQQTAELLESENIQNKDELPFVELPEPVLNAKASSSSVCVSLGNASLEISEEISDTFLIRILGALSHAQ